MIYDVVRMIFLKCPHGEDKNKNKSQKPLINVYTLCILLLKGVGHMNATIQKWGNSQAIRLPKALLEIASLKENEQVQVLAMQNQIIIKKIEVTKRKTLKERLAGFDGDYEFKEWDTGKPVGNEVF